MAHSLSQPTAGNTEQPISAQLVERDEYVLIDAPQVLRELRKIDLSGTKFLDLLTSNLALGKDPEEWLESLAKQGQITVAKRLAARIPGYDTSELDERAVELRKSTRKGRDRLIERLDNQQHLLGKEIADELREMLNAANIHILEGWFDLADEVRQEVERLIDLYLEEADDKRKEYFEQAQRRITMERRAFLDHEHLLREKGTVDTVWELLSYADRISVSADVLSGDVEELCNVVSSLYQGAMPDEEFLQQYRGRFNGVTQQLVVAAPVSPALPSHYPSVVGGKSDEMRLSSPRLLPTTRSLITDIIGVRASLLQLDLRRAVPPTDVPWNEEMASFYAEQLSVLRARRDDASVELLQAAAYLFRYWGEKRKTGLTNEVRSTLTNFAWTYAVVRANSLIRERHWASASEYLRGALHLRSPAVAFRPMFDYLHIYARQSAAPVSTMDSLRNQQNLKVEDVLQAALEAAVKTGDDAGRQRLALGLVKLAAEDSRLLDAVQLTLPNLSPSTAQVIEEGCAHLGVQLATSAGEQSFAALVGVYNQMLHRLEMLLTRVVETYESVASLRATLEGIFENQFYLPLLETTDQDHMEELARITDLLKRYLTPGLSFQDRDRHFADLERKKAAIGLLAQTSPTILGRQYLSPVAETVQNLVEHDHAALRQSALPEIEVEVEQSEWRIDDYYYCHLRVTNHGDIRADNVRLTPEPSNEYELGDEGRELSSLYTDTPRSAHIRVKWTPLRHGQEEFTLVVRVTYQIPQNEGREERVFRLRIAPPRERRNFESFPNPYIVGGLVRNKELFRGRDALISEFLRELADPSRTGAVVISGQKRSGKSSLLYHLSRGVPPFIIPVNFDIPIVLLDLPRGNTTSGDEYMGRLLLALINRIARESVKSGIEVERITWEELMAPPGPGTNFRIFLEQFRDRPDRKRLLLIFDEFTALMDKISADVVDATIMRLLKSLIEQSYFSCIICGLTEVYEVVERFANQLAVAPQFKVDYLSAEAARELIEEPIRMATGESRLSSSWVHKEIFAVTDGNPFYTQMFCYRMVEYMNQARIERVTVADIDEVTLSLIRGDTRIGSVQFDNLYRYKDNPELDDRNAILEGLVVHFIAHETVARTYVPYTVLSRTLQPLGVSDSELTQTLKRLATLGTIMEQKDDTTARQGQQPLRSKQYRLRVELFKRWLLTNRPLDDEAIENFRRRLHQSP